MSAASRVIHSFVAQFCYNSRNADELAAWRLAAQAATRRRTRMLKGVEQAQPEDRRHTERERNLAECLEIHRGCLVAVKPK
jgi:hypothetical protein